MAADPSYDPFYNPEPPEVTTAQRCQSILDGHLCPDDLCHNASEQTLCGAYIEDMDDTRAWDLDDE